jgi:hypothetical protein
VSDGVFFVCCSGNSESAGFPESMPDGAIAAAEAIAARRANSRREMAEPRFPFIKAPSSENGRSENKKRN